MPDDTPHPTPEVRVHCPACDQRHRIVWPSDGRDQVDIQCRPWCGRTLTVTRDGDIVNDNE